MKYYGMIGFWKGGEEVRPGVWRPVIEEREYVGDILQNTRSWQTTDKQNSDLNISNRLSILSDLYMNENLSSIKYVIWMGAKWTVTNIDVAYPRITLTLGGVYNGEEQVRVP